MFVKDSKQLILNGLLRQPEVFADFPIGTSLGNSSKDIPFSF